MVDEQIYQIENYLAKQYGYETKDAQLMQMERLIEIYGKSSPICTAECKKLQLALAERKVVRHLHELDDVLKAVAFIENNLEDLYIREVSMKVYSDFKYFEENTMKPVCTLLRSYAKPINSDRELVCADNSINIENMINTEDAILDEILLLYHITKEPVKLYIKGPVQLIVAGHMMDISGLHDGIEFYASDLANIEKITLLQKGQLRCHCMTIENKTAYLRYNKPDTVTVFISGYANRFVRDF